MSETTTTSEPVQPTTPVEPPAPVDWVSHIPQDVAGEKVWDSYKGKPIGDVLKSFVDSHKYATGAIRLPGEKDKPEEAAAKLRDIYGKLGRPESADQYAVKAPSLPDGIQWDATRETAFKTIAHQLNLTNQQVQGLLDWHGKDILDSIEHRGRASEAGRKKAEEQLRHEWGAAYERNVKQASDALSALSSEALTHDEAKDLLDAINNTGLGNHPAFLKVMARAGKEFGEEPWMRGAGSASDDSVAKQISDLMSKPEYTDPQHPRHEAAVQEVQKLFQLQVNPMRKALQEV